jgi:hypothetical protein
MNQPAILQESPDFSLVLGGPLYQLFRRAHLSGGVLELLHRRIIVITLVAWLPLLVLSVLDGHALGGGVTLPFLHDIETQIRFLIAIPVLIVAELIVHVRLRPVVQSFVKRNLVVREELPKFNAAIDSAIRLRNSVPVELGLLVFVWTAGHWLWRSQGALGTSTWYAIPEGAHLHLTRAGYWLAFVGVPIFQFIMLRWYLRLVIWFRFLWQVSKLNLHFIPTHPDRAAGLAFLGKSSYAFGPILFAQGAMLAGVIASRVLFGGEKLLSFKMGCWPHQFFAVYPQSPPMFFAETRAKRGLADYGVLASRYVEDLRGSG